MKEKIQQLINQGKTYRQIAKELGIKSTNTVAYYAKGVHQHRLRQIKDFGDDEFICDKCDTNFVVKVYPETVYGTKSSPVVSVTRV